jgi:hypothetical protein
VAAAAVQGLTNEQIATRLRLAPATVKAYISRAMTKQHIDGNRVLLALTVGKPSAEPRPSPRKAKPAPGYPPPRPPRRTGHGVPVLPEIYARCIEAQADAASRRITTDALGTQDAGKDVGDERDGDSEHAS